jgi:hypothetical protein
MASVKKSYQVLSEIDVTGNIETKGNIKYLSWAVAWHLLKSAYPDAQRVVYECETTGFNYFTDGKSAWVKVGIVVGGIEHIDYLPVMDYRNSAIPIDKVTQFDVNKTIQRSTAKAIAMHGLGLNLWFGEDTAVGGATEQKSVSSKTQPKKKFELEVDDENWTKVMKYIAANKQLGLETIVKNLETKYNIKAVVKKKISEAVKA